MGIFLHGYSPLHLTFYGNLYNLSLNKKSRLKRIKIQNKIINNI
jgi:hypothetical protein